nr:PREDICTED: chromosome transmission fidelity protein 18 homolog [Anolis carolinensis]XP_008120363.1 PREDICTED: chromosome transmission fidelity protein 18 homolog [Anolis carolinensis]XP_008120364.1 PREDICTED: chromosome transmission fidelity protein 18 homolog [Anolis carolinensis]XP_008120365.1 PREDICTED: chromosome transmission fidelity protein 18 homolog [Anolis carolinensis]XP_008120366.1 PREDICTED: chromosome transmission fidelity protein 18 homolog [Anolis carolinensis]|eukprot:XP_008120362.1 PREDICTED: chromosome transmission fidelity protein 18 homolog [Anolis carolinensis]
MEEYYQQELYGIEDEFEEQFADELEVLAELEEETPPAPSHKVSKLRSQKRTFEEALCAADLDRKPTVVGCHLSIKRDPKDPVLPNGKENAPSPECLPMHAEDPPLDEYEAIQTPKSKRQRCLEAVKKLDFGTDDGTDAKVPCKGDVSPPLSPPSEPQDARTPSLISPNTSGLDGMGPLRVTPPNRRVLRRPPILEDYVNVTSTHGTRVFMVVKEDPNKPEISSSIGQNGRRPLHLLGVPFSYLKEQVAEERRKQIHASSQLLTEVLNSCLGDEEEPAMEEEAAKEEGDKATPHSLWVDRFSPRHYVELLSDDFTNRCLLKWLKLWDRVVFGREQPPKKARHEATPAPRPAKEQSSKWKSKAQATEEALEAQLDPQNRPKYKVALLCGPPGLGKTTLAHVIAKHAGYNVVEMNASDDRSPEAFKTRIEAATQMRSVLGANEKPNCLVIDEIDGAPTASINVLLGIVNRKAAEKESEPGSGKTKRRKEGGLLLRPIICICNDQYVPSLRLLRQQSFLLNFPTTSQSRLVQRLQEVTACQGMKADPGALVALCEKTENDIRSCINTLQFLYSRGKKELTARTVQMAKVGLKDQNKGLFSVWQEIFQLPKMQRQRIGTGLSMSSGGNEGLFTASGRTSVNAAEQRFQRILHLGASSGEHEKLSQGLFENFLRMKVKGSSLDLACLGLEWLGFADLVNQVALNGQSFHLLRFLPFLPVAFHFLFAAPNVPHLAFPSSQQECLAKRSQRQNLVSSMATGMGPGSRSRFGFQVLVLEVLDFLLEIISPKLRPVNPQLFSQKERQQLAELVGTMLAFNLTFLQERSPDGTYLFALEPNVEEVCRFPDLPSRKPLSYQTKQLIAREIDLEKMRRMEALLQARNADPFSMTSSSQEKEEQKGKLKSGIRNHEQRLDQIVKRATFEEKPETDFFGRIIVKKKATPSTADQIPEKNPVEKQIGKAVGNSDVWFRFNEGVSNAVRRNVYIKDLF